MYSLKKKIALSADNKSIQSLNLIKIFAYGMSTDLVCKNVEIKHNIIQLSIQKRLTLRMLQEKT